MVKLFGKKAKNPGEPFKEPLQKFEDDRAARDIAAKSKKEPEWFSQLPDSHLNQEQEVTQPAYYAEEAKLPEGRASKRQLRVYRKLIRKAHIRKTAEMLDRLENQNTSEEMYCRKARGGRYLGRTSQKVYEAIADARAFDEFGRPVRTKKKYESDMLKKFKALDIGDIPKKDSEDGVSSSENRKAARRAKVEDVMNADSMTQTSGGLGGRDARTNTELLTIGYKPEKFAPPGLAAPPVRVKNSENNEKYFNYFGAWKNGKMDGQGTMTFADGLRYEGRWEKGLQEGKGKAWYPNGSTYEGEWSQGKFHGQGLLELPSGSIYEGQFSEGKRHGHGVLMYSSGQRYEGQFNCGVVHGRGVFKGSHDSPFEHRGSFVNGRIQGSGTLLFRKNHWLFPKGYFKKKQLKDLGFQEGESVGWGLVRPWPRTTFQELVLMVMEEELQFWEEQRWENEELTEVLRDDELDEMVESVRDEMAERAAEERAAEQEEHHRQAVERRQGVKDARKDVLAQAEAEAEEAEDD